MDQKVIPRLCVQGSLECLSRRLRIACSGIQVSYKSSSWKMVRTHFRGLSQELERLLILTLFQEGHPQVSQNRKVFRLPLQGGLPSGHCFRPSIPAIKNITKQRSSIGVSRLNFQCSFEDLNVLSAEKGKSQS